jgi:hypothetical protein
MSGEFSFEKSIRKKEFEEQGMMAEEIEPTTNDILQHELESEDILGDVKR